MNRRRIYDDGKQIHFVTFSCYQRRQHLQQDVAKRIVIGEMGSQLSAHKALCLGFVIMPNHIHALVWFPVVEQLSSFMNKWKEMSSKTMKKVLPERFPHYWSKFSLSDPIWQARSYVFHIQSRSKVEQKLEYMHLNPLRAGLVERVDDWRWSSAKWYLHQKTVGVPISWPPGLETDSDFTAQ